MKQKFKDIVVIKCVNKRKKQKISSTQIEQLDKYVSQHSQLNERSEYQKIRQELENLMQSYQSDIEFLNSYQYSSELKIYIEAYNLNTVFQVKNQNIIIKFQDCVIENFDYSLDAYQNKSFLSKSQFCPVSINNLDIKNTLCSQLISCHINYLKIPNLYSLYNTKVKLYEQCDKQTVIEYGQDKFTDRMSYIHEKNQYDFYSYRSYTTPYIKMHKYDQDLFNDVDEKFISCSSVEILKITDFNILKKLELCGLKQIVYNKNEEQSDHHIFDFTKFSELKKIRLMNIKCKGIIFGQSQQQISIDQLRKGDKYSYMDKNIQKHTKIQFLDFSQCIGRNYSVTCYKINRVIQGTNSINFQNCKIWILDLCKSTNIIQSTNNSWDLQNSCQYVIDYKTGSKQRIFHNYKNEQPVSHTLNISIILALKIDNLDYKIFLLLNE